MRSVGRPTEALNVERCLEILALHDPYRCTVAPSPDLSEKIKAEVERLQGQKRVRDLTSVLRIPSPKAPGLNDGLIVLTVDNVLGELKLIWVQVSRVRDAGK